MREKLASRIGFILLSAGCAIGLGNVWRFPYIVGRNGGGWFVLLYLFFLAILGLPVLMMEFAAGRAAQKSIVHLHVALTPGKTPWRLHGFAGLIGNVLLMMFYTVVTGWMVTYFIRMVAGAYDGLEPQAIGQSFGALLGDAKTQATAMIGVCLGSAGVCAVGLQKGLERVTKGMMLCLLALIVALAVNSLRLEGAEKGLAFYLVPNLANLKAVGVVRVVVEAMSQAFFTLSLGIGAMAIFGSYINRERTLLGEAANVCVLDTVVALAAGVIIIPACFAYGIEPGQGPGLIFVTLPNVFNHMPFGRLWGSLFFLFMSCAALTTVLAVFEVIIASIRDLTGWGRGTVSVLLALAIPLLALPCVLGFNHWAAFQPLGAGTCVLDLEDLLVSNLLLPLGALAFALYCCHSCGWGWSGFFAEVNAGKGLRLPAGVRFYCRWVLPVIIFAVFVLGLLDKFHLINLS